MSTVRETGRGERTAYSLYFVGQNIVYMIIQSYLLMYYVSYLKLPPALVATVFLVVRIWDAVNDPLIGVVMDRTRFRGSRHKGWLDLTAIVVPIATFALFLVPPGASQGAKIAAMVITYLLWDVAYTFSEVPSFAISTAMSTREDERTLLLTLTQIGSVLGAAVGVGIATALLGDGVDGINWLLMGAIPSAFGMVVMLPQIFFVHERHDHGGAGQVSLGRMVREVLRNDQHFGMMALYLSQAFLNGATVFATYVAESYYGDARIASITSVFTLLGVVALGVATPRIVKRYGKARFLEVSMIVTIVLSIPIFFIPGSRPLVAMVFLGGRTMTLVVTSILRPMFTADCIEYGEDRTGQRNDSAAFAVQTLFNKTGDAIGQSLGGFLLAIAAFDETRPLAAQPPETMTTLFRWYIILPMVMAAVMWIGPKLFYKLDEARVAELIARNEARRAAAPPER